MGPGLGEEGRAQAHGQVCDGGAWLLSPLGSPRHLGTESWLELGGRLVSIKTSLPGEPLETDSKILHSFPYLPL